jgi:TamB, inner membrane protein subunit of TAM complex
VGENGETKIPLRAGWKRRAKIALAIFGVLVLIFHRPLLQGLVRRIAIHFAANEHLKMDFRLEGNVFTGITVRNFHAVATGPSDIESIDAEFAHGDYSLWRLLRHGPTDAFNNIEVRSAHFVLNPDGTPPKVGPAKPGRKITLPGIIPTERLRLSDVDLVVRNQPQDFVMQHVDIDLNPRTPGELHIEKLQLPTAPAWSKLSAPVSYANSNVLIRDLVLNKDERIRTLKVDASRVRSGILTIEVDSEMGAGKLSGSLVMREAGASLSTETHLVAENVTVEALNKYFGWPEDVRRGNIEQLTIDGTGVINAPRTWSGTASAKINSFREQGIFFDRVDFQVVARDGTATLPSADLVHAQNKFHLSGSGELPADIKQFGRSAATLEFTGEAVDLRAMTAGSSEPMTGSAKIEGKIEIKDGKLEANATASAESIGFKDGKIDKLNSTLKVTKTMPRPNAAKPWFAGLRSEISVNGSDIRYHDYVFDSLEGSLTGTDDLLNIDRWVGRRKQNELNVRGQYRLPEDVSKFSLRPEQIVVTLNATELGDYWISDLRDKISGPLQIEGQVEWKDGIGNGQLSIYGANVRVHDLTFKQLSAQVSVVRNVVYVNDFTASLNESDFVSANGIVDLSEPHHYSGKIAAKVDDLSVLEPLLRAVGNENQLGGSLAITWEGSGEARTLKDLSGTLKATLADGVYGNADSLEANVEAKYSPAGLDVPIIFLRSDKMNFQASAQAKGETLEISQIQLEQEQSKYAAGYISIPFIWKNLGTDQSVCPPDGKVVATFQSENIDVKKLFEDVGAQPHASGVLNVKLDAKGTIADLDARLDVQMRDVRSDYYPRLEPASLDLTAQAQHDQLSIVGKLQQSKIQPAEMTVNLPFDIPKIARARKFPDDTTVTGKLRLPRSSVNFVRQFVPEIDTLDGDLALDVDLKGTVGEPMLSGTGDMTINLGRFHDPTLPTLHDFKARITFAQNAFTLEHFGGELAGGRFTMSGRVTFPKLTSAILDLQLKGDSVLVARNDDVTARTDADLKITGPFLSATVTGTAALTNSQFLKNLDLIPIGLPGRPAPQPLSERPEINFPKPPLRDWKFDVMLKTKDPFLLRGNLANGGAVADLHLTGTGGHPGLAGTVRLENVEATLPFSRLQISYGFLYFDPSDTFNPRIELHGSSVIRDYIVHVYVYGSSLEPEAVFTSEPPLPQEEIISLLAAGTTRSELAGNGSNTLIASRASMLLVQQLYRKIFKKGQATQSSSIFDRLDVDFGTVDPRTGQQQVNARLRVNDQFVVLGDLGVGGDYRGMVKYIIRFR